MSEPLRCWISSTYPGLFIHSPAELKFCSISVSRITTVWAFFHLLPDILGETDIPGVHWDLQQAGVSFRRSHCTPGKFEAVTGSEYRLVIERCSEQKELKSRQTKVLWGGGVRVEESSVFTVFDLSAFFPCRNAAHGFSLIPVDSLKITMKEILQKALKKRKGSQKGSGNAAAEHVALERWGVRMIHCNSFVWLTMMVVPFTTGKSAFYCPGPMYRLEKQAEPNVAVDLDLTLESQNTLEFCLVRENSKCAPK